LTIDVLRHYCRNPRCRSKLPDPVENTREAFCCRGCYRQFYRSHFPPHNSASAGHP